MAESAAYEVGGDGRRVRVQELVHSVKLGVNRIPVNQ